MRRITKNFCVAFVVLFALASLSMLQVDAQERPPRIRTVNGFLTIPTNEQQPTVVDGRTLVPLRAVMEELGFVVSWNRQTQVVTLTKPGYNAIVRIGSREMVINGDVTSLDVPAQIISARTMVPIRAISEAAGMEVRWCPVSRIIDIIEPITIDYWPEHLPQHIPGSVRLSPEVQFESLLGDRYPMRFRAAFYHVSGGFIGLVDSDEASAWLQTVGNEAFEVMTLMRFVQHFNISREDFDAVVDRMRAIHENQNARGVIDINSEWYELPNADIIFTFDDDIIRYFYRRV